MAVTNSSRSWRTNTRVIRSRRASWRRRVIASSRANARGAAPVRRGRAARARPPDDRRPREALAESDVATDLHLARGHDLGQEAAQRHAEHRGHVAGKRHVRFTVALRAQLQAGFLRQHENLERRITRGPQPDHPALKLRDTRARIRVETQSKVDGLL